MRQSTARIGSRSGSHFPQSDLLKQYLSISCCPHLEQRVSVKRFVPLQSFHLRQAVGFLGRGISPVQGCYLHRTTQTQNKRRQTSTPLAGYKPTIPVLKRAKTLYALDRAATVIGSKAISRPLILVSLKLLTWRSLRCLASRKRN
jgi:hypothetical protein